MCADKTFWFVNYEGQRFATTLTNHSVVPTAAFKTGTFTYNGQVIDVSSPTASSNLFQLPLDPTMQRILSLYPVPNGPQVDDVRGLFVFSQFFDNHRRQCHRAYRPQLLLPGDFHRSLHIQSI